jgi:hypothetical protein
MPMSGQVRSGQEPVLKNFNFILKLCFFIMKQPFTLTTAKSCFYVIKLKIMAIVRVKWP